MTCSIDGCDRPKKTRGMCGMHAERVRDGRPLTDPPRNQTARPFDSWVAVVETGCHEWQGRISTAGYGRYGKQYAHRIAYTQHKGPIPAGRQIDHLCRNRRCVNPEHLEAVTPRVNTLRGITQAAIAVRTNRCIRGHEYNAENTYYRLDGRGRNCRACQRITRRQLAEARAAA